MVNEWRGHEIGKEGYQSGSGWSGVSGGTAGEDLLLWLVRRCLPVPSGHWYKSCFFVTMVKYLMEACKREESYFCLELIMVGSMVE